MHTYAEGLAISQKSSLDSDVFKSNPRKSIKKTSSNLRNYEYECHACVCVCVYVHVHVRFDSTIQSSPYKIRKDHSFILTNFSNFSRQGSSELFKCQSTGLVTAFQLSVVRVRYGFSTFSWQSPSGLFNVQSTGFVMAFRLSVDRARHGSSIHKSYVFDRE